LFLIFAIGVASNAEPKDYAPPPSVWKHLEADSQVDVRYAINSWLASDYGKATTIDH